MWNTESFRKEKQWKKTSRGTSPGNPEVKNLHFNAGDKGLTHGLETKILRAMGQLSPCTTLLSLWSRAEELQLLKPMCPRAQAPEQEEPPQWEAHVPQLEKAQMQQQRARALQQRPRVAKNK